MADSRETRGRVNCQQKLRRVKATPDPNTFEKYRDTPPISIAILLQKYAFLAESNIYNTNLYHDLPPICIAKTFAEVWGQGSLPHSKKAFFHRVLQGSVPRAWQSYFIVAVLQPAPFCKAPK